MSEGIPDISAIEAAGRSVTRVLNAQTLVVLESTTYPGTTEDVLRPLLEASGMIAGRDFYLAYSPERIDPGNESYGFSDIPKVVGGVSEGSTVLGAALYSQVVAKVVAVSDTRTAEMTKLIENTFRHVNIGLVSELAQYASEWEVDIWEAIEAAATKPFGYMPFWPGAGWGGHCIPLDPSFLSWKVRRDHSHEIRFVELAQTVNSEMPKFVVERIGLLLNDRGKAVRGARIMCIGVAYKGGTNDTRGSSGEKVLTRLARQGAHISYHDPLVPTMTISGETLDSAPLDAKSLGRQDLVVTLIPQVQVDWELVKQAASMILDCSNVLGEKSDRIVRL
jgi:nucleotide sugar dehydrogenase